MKTAEIFALCMVITVVSFLGFVVENVWLSVTKGFIDNRNMCLPFLLGYGLAIAAIYLVFGTPSGIAFLGKELAIENTYLKALLYFIAVMIGISIGEIALGKLVEKTCHVIWWDYSSLPMHITRYTSVLTSMGFAALITVFMQYFFEPLMVWFMKMDVDVLMFSAVAWLSALVIDFLHNAVKVYKEKEMKPLWKIDTKHTRVYQRIHSMYL